MSLAPATLSPIEAYEELMRFASKFGEAPLRLAFHAAVPQSFRLDLLHLIKRNFVPEAKNDPTTESDLLLSPLCKDIGRGYFQFDSNVRYLLLDNLAETYASEPIPRIQRVANFLLWYANHFNRLTSGSNDCLWRDYLETQRWVALAFIDPESAALQFAECLRRTVTEKDVVTRLQLGGLAASLSAPLAGYSHLLNYASALQSLETEGADETIEKFGNFLDKEIKIGDVTLRPASAIIREQYELPPTPENSEEVYSDDSIPRFKFYPSMFIPSLEFFTGRRKLLKDLEKKLNTTHRASLHDISGSGKTFATYKYAYEKQNEYEEIFFVRANKEEMMQSLAEIGVLLNPSLKDTPNQTQQALEFKNWLEENENWLVIYDNVDKPDELIPFVPQSKKGDCIFTSNFASVTSLAEEIKIDKLDKAEAESLLFSRAKGKTDSEYISLNAAEYKALEVIVKELDGHPLSLNIAGAFIHNQALSFAEFAEEMIREPNILLEHQDPFDSYQRKSTLNAFSSALEDISAQTGDSENLRREKFLAGEIVDILAWSGSSGMGISLLRALTAEENENAFKAALGNATNAGLIKQEADAERYSIHPLLARVRREENPLQGREYWAETIVRRLQDWFGNSLKLEEYSSEIQAEIEHISRWRSVIVNINPVEAINLVLLEARLNRRQNNYQEAETALREALYLYQNSRVGDEKLLATIYYELSITSYNMLKYQEALEHQQQALEIQRKVPGNKPLELAASFDNLSLIYKALDNYEQALRYQEEAFHLIQEFYGENHPTYITQLNNLGEIYRHQGRYKEAVELFEQALSAAKKILGTEHPTYAVQLNNLAGVYHLQARYDEAIPLYKQAIEIGAKTFGTGHPQYAVRLNNLANIYYLQSRYEEAIESFKQALEIDEKTLSKEHPQYAVHLNNLALVYTNQRKYNEALELFEQALRIFEKTLPENHPSINQTRENLASCRANLENKPTPPDTMPSIYVICDKSDFEAVLDLENWLIDNNYLILSSRDYLEPALAGDPEYVGKIHEYHNEYLTHCDAVLIYWHNARLPWVRKNVLDLQGSKPFRKGREFLFQAVFCDGNLNDRDKASFRTPPPKGLRKINGYAELPHLFAELNSKTQI